MLHTRNATRFDSLIVPYDLTDVADRVLPVIGGLARRGGLAVRLVTIASPGLEERDLAELAEHTHRINGYPMSRVVIGGNDTAGDIAEFAGRHMGALLCLATHGRTALGEMFLGSLTDDLLRRHLGPVLIVGPRVDEDAELGDDLLVCIDDFAVHSPLLDAAEAWQRTFGGRVDLFEAVVPDARTAKASLPTELQRAQAQVPMATATTVESHDPARAILDAASQRNSTIALASHLRRGLERAVLGSVAWEVVRSSATPVLVVPS